jgi:16S rRNA (guanine527-N7)-methyltransferase
LKNAIGVFLKGEDWRGELTGLTPESSFQTRNIVSRTNTAARIIVVEKADSNGTGASPR